MMAYGQTRVTRGDLRLTIAVILVFALTLTTVVAFMTLRDGQQRIYFLEDQLDQRQKKMQKERHDAGQLVKQLDNLKTEKARLETSLVELSQSLETAKIQTDEMRKSRDSLTSDLKAALAQTEALQKSFELQLKQAKEQAASALADATRCHEAQGRAPELKQERAPGEGALEAQRAVDAAINAGLRLRPETRLGGGPGKIQSGANEVANVIGEAR